MSPFIPQGEHPIGLALDIVPDKAAGGSWSDITRLAAVGGAVAGQAACALQLGRLRRRCGPRSPRPPASVLEPLRHPPRAPGEADSRRSAARIPSAPRSPRRQPPNPGPTGPEARPGERRRAARDRGHRHGRGHRGRSRAWPSRRAAPRTRPPGPRLGRHRRQARYRPRGRPRPAASVSASSRARKPGATPRPRGPMPGSTIPRSGA